MFIHGRKAVDFVDFRILASILIWEKTKNAKITTFLP